MRRKDREIKDRAVMEALLREAQVCSLAMCQDNMPYVVPMNFGYKDGCLYMHSARQGKKVDILKSNSNVCIEVDFCREITKGDKACDWGALFDSVIGFGKACFVEDANEKIKGLNAIMEKYSGQDSFEYSGQHLAGVAVIKVEISSMTGKSRSK